MLQKIELPRLNSSARTTQLLYRATESAGYVTIVIGYLISVFSASNLTITTFLVFTGLQIAYTFVFWWASTQTAIHRWQMPLSIVSLFLLTFATGMMVLLGVYLDWLVYFVTVALYCMVLSLPLALFASFLLYLAVGFSLYLTNGAIGLSQPWVFLLAGFAFVGLFSLANKSLVKQRERSDILLSQLEASNREREQANIQLQKYANEVEELTIDRERTRMAREIHDTLGHYLTILSIQLETISKLQERDPARAMLEVEEARRVAAQSMQEVRNAVAALRPSSIATLSLAEALTQLADEFRETMRETELALDLETRTPPLSSDLQLTLYRATQEALTNIRKHAHATKVLVRLRYEEAVLELVILDNGRNTVGDTPKPIGSGFGLIGLRERVELLGSGVVYGVEANAGYRVTIRVPAANREKDEDVHHG